MKTRKARRRGQKAKGKGQKAKSKGHRAQGKEAAAGLHVVGEKQLRALKKKIEKKAAMRWNPDSAEVQRSVIKLVLTLVELIRKLMERQAIRRIEARTMTKAETEAVGKALM